MQERQRTPRGQVATAALQLCAATPRGRGRSPLPRSCGQLLVPGSSCSEHLFAPAKLWQNSSLNPPGAGPRAVAAIHRTAEPSVPWAFEAGPTLGETSPTPFIPQPQVPSRVSREGVAGGWQQPRFRSARARTSSAWASPPPRRRGRGTPPRRYPPSLPPSLLLSFSPSIPLSAPGKEGGGGGGRGAG